MRLELLQTLKLLMVSLVHQNSQALIACQPAFQHHSGLHPT